MTTVRRRRLPLIALAGSLALVAPLMLSGCSLIHFPGPHGGGTNIPGFTSAETGKLPGDFPKDVPVISGDLVSGLTIGTGNDKAWNVTIKVSGVVAFDDIASQLKGAGFTQEEVGGKTDDGATGLFAKHDYTVDVLVVREDDKTGWVANYAVSRSSEDNN